MVSDLLPDRPFFEQISADDIYDLVTALRAECFRGLSNYRVIRSLATPSR